MNACDFVIKIGQQFLIRINLLSFQNDGNYNGNYNRNNLYDDRVNPYTDRNVYSERNPYENFRNENRNPYENNRYNGENRPYDGRPNDGRPYDQRNQFNDDRPRYNNDRPYDPRNPPSQYDDYDDRNKYTQREYEQHRLELERQNRLEDANLRRILDDVDKLASSECSINVGAQWNFETNVNEVTQQESVCTKVYHTPAMCC